MYIYPLQRFEPHACLAVVDEFIQHIDATWGRHGYYPYMSMTENITELQHENAQLDDYSSIPEAYFLDKVGTLMDTADEEAKVFYATIVSAATTIQRAVRRARARRK